MDESLKMRKSTLKSSFRYPFHKWEVDRYPYSSFINMDVARLKTVDYIRWLKKHKINFRAASDLWFGGVIFRFKTEKELLAFLLIADGVKT